MNCRTFSQNPGMRGKSHPRKRPPGGSWLIIICLAVKQKDAFVSFLAFLFFISLIGGVRSSCKHKDIGSTRFSLLRKLWSMGH